MAARYFIPTSGEYAWTGSVWAATSTGAAGSAATPVDGDDVYILSGTARITSALDQSSVQLNSLTIGFSGEIGTSGASLQIGLDTSDKAHLNGSGTLRLTIVETSGSTLNIYDDFTGTVYLNSCTIANVYAGRRGQCVVAGGTFTAIETSGCAFTINSVSALGLFSANGTGNHRLLVSPTSITIYGTSIVTVSGVNAGAGVEVLVYGSGTYVHDSGATISRITLLSLAKATTTGNYGGFTVTDRVLWAGSQCFENPSVLITYTNAATKYGFR